MIQGAPTPINLYLVDILGNPYPGLTFASGEVEISINGGAWAPIFGTTLEVGAGLYVYTPTIVEAGTLGTLTIKVAKTGVQPFVYAVDIVPASTVNELLTTVMFPNAAVGDRHTFADAFRLLCAEKFGDARGLDGPIGSHDAIGEDRHALEWRVFSGTRTMTKRDGSE